MLSKQLSCNQTNWRDLSTRQIFRAMAVWTAFLLGAVLVRKALQLTQADFLPALLVALAPVATAFALRVSGRMNWPLVVAGLILGLATFVPAVLSRDTGRTFFATSGMSGSYIILLAMYRSKPGMIIRTAIALAVLALVVVSFV